MKRQQLKHLNMKGKQEKDPLAIYKLRVQFTTS